MAVRGTPGDTGEGTTPCNTRSLDVQDTGANPGCVSAWGAFDMVGNRWEWVADWGPLSTCFGSWPSGFGGDRQGICGATESDSAPGALIRGGGRNSGTIAGPFAVNGFNEPSNSTSSEVGFRGAR